MAEIVVKSKIKEAVKDCNVAGDFYEALEVEVKKLIAKAEKRAISNGRKTVSARDL